MAVRNRHPQAFAPGAAAMAAGHVGRGPRLVDEDEPLGIEIELGFEPGPTLLQDVGTILLDRVAGLFLRVSREHRSRHKAPWESPAAIQIGRAAL